MEIYDRFILLILPFTYMRMLAHVVFKSELNLALNLFIDSFSSKWVYIK